MVQENRLKERILVIGGPTCVGKSDFAVKLAKKYDGEIISADSVQIYRGLDIGSGKITERERKGIPHYLLDVVDPTEPFTVVDFIERAQSLITEITNRGKLPIVVGGTGFYINALLNGYNCGDAEPNYPLRERLHLLEELNGEGYLHRFLTELEPDTSVKANDTPRIERQLEWYLSPEYDRQSAPMCYEAYRALLIVMDADRSQLDELADLRIRKMLQNGLLDEVRGLRKYWKFGCMATVGYREAILGIECGMSDDEIAAIMRANYHALIKKQQTFFRWMPWGNKIYLQNRNAKNVYRAVREFLEK